MAAALATAIRAVRVQAVLSAETVGLIRACYARTVRSGLATLGEVAKALSLGARVFSKALKKQDRK